MKQVRYLIILLTLFLIGRVAMFIYRTGRDIELPETGISIEILEEKAGI